MKKIIYLLLIAQDIMQQKKLFFIIALCTAQTLITAMGGMPVNTCVAIGQTCINKQGNQSICSLDNAGNLYCP